VFLCTIIININILLFLKISNADYFSKIVAQACINSKPDNGTDFDLEFVRVAKILGASVEESFV